MIKRFLLALSLIGAVSLSAQEPIARLQEAVQQTNGRVMIKLKYQHPDTTPAMRMPGSPRVSVMDQRRMVARLRTSHGGMRVHRALEATSMMVADIQPAKLAEILADTNVAAVEPDRLWRLVETVDTPDPWEAYRKRAQTTPYGITQVTAPQVWATGNRGQGIKVGMIDSGGDTDHPDIAWAGGYDATGHGNWEDDVAPCGGHGTHVAGTVAALDNDIGVVGVAPSVQIYALKVFSDMGGRCLAYTSTQISALNWGVTNGIRVFSVSIGGGASVFYNDAVTNAVNAGVIFVAAAGNSGGAMESPGNFTKALGIGAVDGSNNRASWSAYGVDLDFVAPGVGTLSTLPGGGWGTKSGTSMATPHAAGVVALMLSANPALTYDQIRNKLINGALDLGTPGFDVYMGNGLVRAFNAINANANPPDLPTIVVAPLSRATTAQLGGTAPDGSATVTLAGNGAATVPWTVVNTTNIPPCSGFMCGAPRPQWATLTTTSGTGSGTIGWHRSTTGLGLGTWVNTFTVTSVGTSTATTVITDSLIITAAPVCTLGVTGATTRNYTVAVAGMTVTDTAIVTGTCLWTATMSRTPLTISGNRIIFTASATDTLRIIKQ